MGVLSRIGVAGDTQSATERAAGLATRQFGVVARRQLLASGFTPTRVRSWIRQGRLHPRYPGVYAWGRPDTGDEGDLAAALLFARRGSALGGLTALWWRELLERRPQLIHVDAPGRVGSSHDVRVRHPRRLARESHRGLPVVPLPEALLVAAEELSRNSLRLVLARAEFQGRLSLTALEMALGKGRRGSEAVRAAMRSHLPQLARCASPLERDFILLCERIGIELPEPNTTIGRYRPDMLWRDARLIVELDGRASHHTAAQRSADRSRQAHLEALGYTVLRFTWWQVTHGAGLLATELRSHLGRTAT